MTDPIEPLTYQHRTNIEEHKQFFDKINEIIDSLESTVTAYNTRLSNLETADEQNVKLTGTQTIAGNKSFTGDTSVPTEATGTFSMKAANSTKIKNELDAYDPMVRTTGNQTVAGTKTFTSMPVSMKHNIAVGANAARNFIAFYDVNDEQVAALRMKLNNNGTTTFYIQVRNSDGTFKDVMIATGDVI